MESASARSVPAPAFLIVGTPRSGTTLVQRIATEIQGVHVPPETHFFDQFALGLLRRRTFPLTGPAIEHEVGALLRLRDLRGLDLDPGRVREAVDGRCVTAVELFGAVVAALAPETPTVGEKTPRHLHWWRALSAAMPSAKLVCVVRDARAVVASNRRTPWGRRESIASLAEEWAMDQRQVLRARATLSHDRLLVIRYEDVIDDPERERARLARFLGRPQRPSTPASDELFLAWEWWKRRALDPPSAERRDEWRAELQPGARAVVRAVAARELAAFGYDGDECRPADRSAVSARARDRARRTRRAEMARIGRAAALPGFGVAS